MSNAVIIYYIHYIFIYENVWFFLKISWHSKYLKCTWSVMIQKHFMHTIPNDPLFWIIFSCRYVYNINQAGLILSWKTKCSLVLSDRIDSKPIATDSRHLLGHCGMDCCGLPCQQTYMIWSNQYAVNLSNHWLYDII